MSSNIQSDFILHPKIKTMKNKFIHVLSPYLIKTLFILFSIQKKIVFELLNALLENKVDIINSMTGKIYSDYM